MQVCDLNAVLCFRGSLVSELPDDRQKKREDKKCPLHLTLGVQFQDGLPEKNPLKMCRFSRRRRDF
jgi:hypothetical protein